MTEVLHAPHGDPLAKGLSIRSLSVRYAGVLALEAFDLDVPRGAVVGLIGPNGAGKSTCLNAIHGYVAPVQGDVWLDGERTTGFGPLSLWRRRVGRTFQQAELFWNMTVEENLLVAAQRRHGAHSRSARSAVDDAVHFLELEHARDLLAARISTGVGRLVEFGRAMCAGADFLLLDEPSSGLDARETARFAELMLRVRAEKELSVLIVEHDMTLVEQVTDEVYVLDFGRLVARGVLSDLRRSPLVQQVYLGGEVAVP